MRPAGLKQKKLHVLEKRAEAGLDRERQRLGTAAPPADKGSGKAWHGTRPAAIRVTNKFCFFQKGRHCGCLLLSLGWFISKKERWRRKVEVHGSGHGPVWGQEVKNDLGGLPAIPKDGRMPGGRTWGNPSPADSKRAPSFPQAGDKHAPRYCCGCAWGREIPL